MLLVPMSPRLEFAGLQRRGMFSTLCHFSTSEVYGSAVYEPMDEQHPDGHPTTTPREAARQLPILAVESYVHTCSALTRSSSGHSNNYGPRQNYRGLLAGVIPLTASRISFR